MPTLNLEGLIRKIQRRRRGTHLAQGGSPGSQGRRNAPPLAQPHPRKRLFALLWQIRLARIPTEAVSNLRLPSVSLATPSSSPRNDRPALFVRPVLALCTLSAPRRSPPRASLDSEVRWTRNKTALRSGPQIAAPKGGSEGNRSQCLRATNHYHSSRATHF